MTQYFSWRLVVTLVGALALISCQNQGAVDETPADSVGENKAAWTLGGGNDDPSAMLSNPGAEADKKSVLGLIDWIRRSSASSGSQSDKYVFDVNDLQEIAKKGIGLPTDQMFAAIHQELRRRYPNKVAENFRFIINDAGGALGQVAILYGAANEYLIFFGSPISNVGHSGRYPRAEFYDFMLEGEMQLFIEGQTNRQTFKPGDVAYLGRGQAKGYKLADHGWMLEYCRGNIVELFPFGVIAPASFITLDWQSAWAQISDFAKVAFHNVLHP